MKVCWTMPKQRGVPNWTSRLLAWFITLVRNGGRWRRGIESKREREREGESKREREEEKLQSPCRNKDPCFISKQGIPFLFCQVWTNLPTSIKNWQNKKGIPYFEMKQGVFISTTASELSLPSSLPLSLCPPHSLLPLPFPHSPCFWELDQHKQNLTNESNTKESEAQVITRRNLRLQELCTFF